MGHSFARITNAVGHLFHGVESGVTQFVSTVLPDLTDTTPSPRVDTFGHGQTPPSLLRPTPVNQTPAVRLQGNTSLRNRISSLSTLPQTREQMLATLDRLAEASRTLAAQRENNPEMRDAAREEARGEAALISALRQRIQNPQAHFQSLNQALSSLDYIHAPGVTWRFTRTVSNDTQIDYHALGGQEVSHQDYMRFLQASHSQAFVEAPAGVPTILLRGATINYSAPHERGSHGYTVLRVVVGRQGGTIRLEDLGGQTRHFRFGTSGEERVVFIVRDRFNEAQVLSSNGHRLSTSSEFIGNELRAFTRIFQFESTTGAENSRAEALQMAEDLRHRNGSYAEAGRLFLRVMGATHPNEIWRLRRDYGANRLDPLSRRAYDAYVDMTDCFHQWANADDATWDRRADDVAINVPFLVASGGSGVVTGAATRLGVNTLLSGWLARAGTTALGRWIATNGAEIAAREGVSQVGQFLSSRGARYLAARAGLYVFGQEVVEQSARQMLARFASWSAGTLVSGSMMRLSELVMRRGIGEDVHLQADRHLAADLAMSAITMGKFNVANIGWSRFAVQRGIAPDVVGAALARGEITGTQAVIRNASNYVGQLGTEFGLMMEHFNLDCAGHALGEIIKMRGGNHLAAPINRAIHQLDQQVQEQARRQIERAGLETPAAPSWWERAGQAIAPYRRGIQVGLATFLAPVAARAQEAGEASRGMGIDGLDSTTLGAVAGGLMLLGGAVASAVRWARSRPRRSTETNEVENRPSTPPEPADNLNTPDLSLPTYFGTRESIKLKEGLENAIYGADPGDYNLFYEPSTNHSLLRPLNETSTSHANNEFRLLRVRIEPSREVHVEVNQDEVQRFETSQGRRIGEVINRYAGNSPQLNYPHALDEASRIAIDRLLNITPQYYPPRQRLYPTNGVHTNLPEGSPSSYAVVVPSLEYENVRETLPPVREGYCRLYRGANNRRASGEDLRFIPEAQEPLENIRDLGLLDFIPSLPQQVGQSIIQRLGLSTNPILEGRTTRDFSSSYTTARNYQNMYGSHGRLFYIDIPESVFYDLPRRESGILAGYGEAIPLPPEYWDQAVEIIHEPNI